jgi:hypothetical protein
MTYIDNSGTATHIHDSLIDMATKLTSLGGDISKLNQWVLEQVQKLACLGEQPPNLLPYLWRAYQAAPDDEFISYIKTLRHQHEDRRSICTSDSLMTLAENKYKLQLQTNEWGKQAPNHSELVALVAQLKKTSTNRANSVRKSKQERSSNESNKNSTQLPEWKLLPPKEGEKHTKQRNSRTYHWCPCHATDGM